MSETNDTPEETPVEFVTETYSIPSEWVGVMSGAEVLAFDDLLSEGEVIEEGNPLAATYTVTLRSPREVAEKIRTQMALWATKYGNGEVDHSPEHAIDILTATLSK